MRLLFMQYSGWDPGIENRKKKQKKKKKKKKIEKRKISIFYSKPGGSDSEESAAMQENQVLSLGWEVPLQKEVAIHSSTLALKIPWTEEPVRLQSTGSQRIGHNGVTNTLDGSWIRKQKMKIRLKTKEI